MTPFIQAIGLLVVVAAVVAVACFVIAWIDIVIQRGPKTRPNPAEMRRFMMCGFYCNPEDRRPVVHRPFGRGYTINLRREHLVVVLIVMTVLATLAAVLLYAVPVQPS